MVALHPAPDQTVRLNVQVQGLGDYMSDRDIDDLFTLADKSGNGSVEFDEFIAFILGDENKPGPRQPSQPPQLERQWPSRLPGSSEAAGRNEPAAAAAAVSFADEQPGSSRQHAEQEAELELAGMRPSGWQTRPVPPWQAEDDPESAAAEAVPNHSHPSAMLQTAAWGGQHKADMPQHTPSNELPWHVQESLQPLDSAADDLSLQSGGVRQVPDHIEAAEADFAVQEGAEPGPSTSRESC